MSNIDEVMIENAQFSLTMSPAYLAVLEWYQISMDLTIGTASCACLFNDAVFSHFVTVTNPIARNLTADYANLFFIFFVVLVGVLVYLRLNQSERKWKNDFIGQFPPEYRGERVNQQSYSGAGNLELWLIEIKGGTSTLTTKLTGSTRK